MLLHRSTLVGETSYENGDGEKTSDQKKKKIKNELE